MAGLRSRTRPAQHYRFGVFEADAASGELCKSGMGVKLNSERFQVLLMILERPGQLVTRDEISRMLWPEGTPSTTGTASTPRSIACARPYFFSASRVARTVNSSDSLGTFFINGPIIHPSPFGADRLNETDSTWIYSPPSPSA